jgi:type II secretory pathway component PulF
MTSLFAPATSRRRFVSRIGNALVYPLIIATLAYFGFLYLCQVTIPSIQSIYLQLNKSMPPLLAFLTDVKHWIPVWSVLVPVLLILSIVWWRRRGAKQEWSWLPGSHRYYHAIDHAHMADQLAGMLESGCTLGESLTAITSTSVSTDPHPQEAKTTDLFPPLLRWAIVHEPSAEGFRSVARTYRQLADQRERVWRFLVPTLVGLAVGGLIVLVYGLSLFLPMIQLLEDVAIPVAGRRGG